MAAAKRFAELRETVRTHPVVVASSAATAGVLLGGFVAVQLLGTPQLRADGAPAEQAVAESRAPPKPVAETTGSAPAGDSVASAECEQQTWPHLSRVCMEEYRSKHRVARVVSTDKLDKQTIDAIESPPAETTIQPKLAAPAPWAPAVVSIAPIAPASTALIAAGVPPATPVSEQPASTATVAPEASPPAAATRAPASQSASPAIAKSEAKAVANSETKETEQAAAKHEAKEKHVAKKAKRKPKAERKVPIKPKVDDDDEDTVATASSDDRDDDRIARRRHDRSRRIVERWTERDYDVPAEDGRGRRRVTVIRRGGGGAFGSLFGGFRD